MKLISDYQILNLWYWKPAIKFKLIQYTKNRSMDWIESKDSRVFGITVRNMKCHSVQHLDFLMKALHFCDRNFKRYNFYYSMAVYYLDGIPNQNMNLAERKDTLEKWNKNYWKSIRGVDFFLDIDAPDGCIDEAFRQSLRIKAFFDSFMIPYYYRFSGKGFHFVIPHDRLVNLDISFNPEDNNVMNTYYEIAKYFHDNYTEMIDITIYDMRRVLKIPYSLALYKNEAYVCCPIDDEFINEFLRSGVFELFKFQFPYCDAEEIVNIEDKLHNPDCYFDIEKFIRGVRDGKTKKRKKADD